MSRFDQKSTITSCTWRLLAIRRATVQRLWSVATSHEPCTPLSWFWKICFGVKRRLGNQVSMSSPGASATLAGVNCFANQAWAPPAAFTWAARAGVNPQLNRLIRCRSAADSEVRARRSS